MNIYFRELKAHRKSIIIWSLVMILFVFMGMQKYNALVGQSGDTTELMKLVSGMPKFIQSMWGLSSLDITTAIGYFGVVYSYLVLMAAIHASMLGSNIVYKEERDKTAEFLMSKPVSRSKIITSKIFAALTNIVIFNLVTFICAIFVLKGMTNQPIVKEIVLCMVSTFFVQLFFMIVGVCFASIMKKPKKSGTIAMFILLATYLLSLVVDITDKLAMLTILTPFKYFSSQDIFVSGSLSLWYILLVIALTIGMLVITYRKYNERDLNL